MYLNWLPYWKQNVPKQMWTFIAFVTVNKSRTPILLDLPHLFHMSISNKWNCKTFYVLACRWYDRATYHCPYGIAALTATSQGNVPPNKAYSARQGQPKWRGRPVQNCMVKYLKNHYLYTACNRRLVKLEDMVSIWNLGRVQTTSPGLVVLIYWWD